MSRVVLDVVTQYISSEPPSAKVLASSTSEDSSLSLHDSARARVDGMDDAESVGKSGGGLVLSATYLTAAFGGTPAYYSLRLGQPCTSSVIVHLLFVLDAVRSLRVSSDRICFTPETYNHPQLVRVDVLDAHAHSSAISHRVYSLDKRYDRIATPTVVVKTASTGIGTALLSFGGPMSKRRAVAVGSAITPVDLRRAIPTLPSLPPVSSVDGSTSNLLPGTNRSSQDELPLQRDPRWSVSHAASGHNFSLAVVTHQSTMLLAWGVNASGELGLGSTATSLAEPQRVTLTPTLPNELLGVVSVACGKHHAALVTATAKLFTWGANKYGQLGHSDYTNRLAPTEVHLALTAVSSNNQRALRLTHTIRERSSGTSVTHVACGAAHTLVVVDQQSVLAMGYNQAGQLGLGHCLQTHKRWRSCVPIAIDALRDRSILDVAAGQNHSACVLSNGAVYVWGCADDGRLGLGVGHRDCATTPVAVTSLREGSVRARAVRCGARHTSVVSDRDVLYVWGANEFGQLGCGDKASRHRPCVVSTPAFVAAGVADVSLGEFHSVAILHSGAVYAWGLDLSAASAEIDQRSAPALLALPRGQRAQRVSCGWGHTNVVTHTSYDDSPMYSQSCRSPTASAAQLTSPLKSPRATGFERAIARKALALRRDELAQWRAFAAPWGLSGSDRTPAASKRNKAAAATQPASVSNVRAAVPVCASDHNGAMWCQRVAAAFVHDVMQRSVCRLVLARTNGEQQTPQTAHSLNSTVDAASVSPSRQLMVPPSLRAPRNELHVSPRGIFYHNALQPPALPPSSTVALRSLATSYHQQHQQLRPNELTSDFAIRSSSAASAARSPTALCPTRPQSSARARPHAPPWSPREHRPLTGARSARNDPPDLAASELRQSCCTAVRSPRAPARVPLGVLETLMHTPSFSIAHAVLVAPALRPGTATVRSPLSRPAPHRPNSSHDNT